MSNYSFHVRAKCWAKFMFNCAIEKFKGLDFSMLYVDQQRKDSDDYHGYSMTDAGDMKRILKALPVDVTKAAFLDVGCGKGMCIKCAAEVGYKKADGIDLDLHLLKIARRNMEKLGIPAQCIYADATEFENYADYDVFYFYNPFGKRVFEQVINRIKSSQARRARDIWVIYYHPVYGSLFENSGFALKKELPDHTRDTTTRFYCLSPYIG